MRPSRSRERSREISEQREDPQLAPATKCMGCNEPPLPDKKLCQACLITASGVEANSNMGILAWIKEAVAKEISVATASTSRSPQLDFDPDPEDTFATRASEDRGSSTDEGEEVQSSFDFALIQPLIKAVRASLVLEDESQASTSSSFLPCSKPKGQTFPLHQEVMDLIKAEWDIPSKRSNMLARGNKLYPFKDDEVKDFSTLPKVDAPVLNISKSTLLPIEDQATLKDPMDKHLELDLKRLFTTAGESLKPAIANLSVAKALEVWLANVDVALREGRDRTEILEGLKELKLGSAFLVNSSVDQIRLASKSLSLSVAARRALWLRAWEADSASKVALCSLPFQGQVLFGKKMEDLISKASGGKSQLLPQKKKRQMGRPSFRGKASPRSRFVPYDRRPFRAGRETSKQDSWKAGQSGFFRMSKGKAGENSRKQL
ncbi:lamina-associated polypeptide 2, isoforms alpha/zeta-like [Xenopus laevis]|uniref:Lamina-associated polypeptide 2, isoforms alpha/zeta-like n=1 Tax=Xenopus laevis TaxID=8355 RepID=A0A8J1MYV4_XENLA|nr:lamina-associated polypeptide 2, isoforms alpha/zeta-like [Xenopus laevis]